MNTTKPTAPTSDRWMKMDENTTIITTALTNITSIFLSDFQIGDKYKINIWYGENAVPLWLPTHAEAEAFRDEILAKIDRL